jgi:enamine deaminase RidA (YjgF/YER057c/UK114 family)
MPAIEQRLNDLGIKLPPPKAPVANYLGCKRSGDLLFVSARVSALRGEVGTEIDRDEAKQSARETALTILGIIRGELGSLDQIHGVEQMQGFVRSAPTFTEQPYVIDGASELLIEVFGEEGRHARTATGAAQLPFGAAVQLDMVMAMEPPRA